MQNGITITLNIGRFYSHVEAEQDPAKANPFEYAQKARAYIREKTGL